METRQASGGGGTDGADDYLLSLSIWAMLLLSSLFLKFVFATQSNSVFTTVVQDQTCPISLPPLEPEGHPSFFFFFF